MGYSSGEIDTGLTIPFSMLAAGGVASVVSSSSDSQIWFIGGQPLVQVTFDSLNDLALGSAANQGIWKAQALTVGGGGPWIQAGSAVAIVDRPYLFGCQLGVSPTALAAASYGTTGQSGTQSWGNAAQLCGTDQAHSPIYTAAGLANSVSASAFGADTILVACANTSYSAPNCTQGGPNLYLGVFNTADNGSPTAGQWVPRYEYTWAVSDLQKLNPSITGLGVTVSIDWFVTEAQDTSGPVFYLAISLLPGGASATSIYARLALDENNVPLIDERYICWDSYPSTAPVTVARDPAGRLRGYAPGHGQITTYTFSTTAAPDPSKSGTGKTMSVAIGQIAAPSAGGPVAVAYYVDHHAPLTVPLQGQDMQGQARTYPAQQYPVYEILLYCKGDMIAAALKCQVSSYAYAQTLLGNYPLSPPTMNVITAIIDGPMPMANANVKQDWSTTTVQADLGDLVYGTDQTLQSGHQTEYQWSAGFQSEGEPTSGWGPAWDISFSSGTGSISASSSGTEVGTTLTGPSWVYYDKSDPAATAAVDTHGFVQVAQAQFDVQLYRFLEASGVAIAGNASGGPAPDGSASLYARSDGGALLHFYQAPGATTWGYDNLSWEVNNASPVLIAGSPAWLPDNGHVYACGADGRLLDFSVDSNNKWTYGDLSGQAGSQLIAGDPLPATIGGQVHIFVRGTGKNGVGALLHFSAALSGGHESILGAQILGDPTISVGSDGANTVVSLFVRLAKNNHLLQYYNGAFPDTSKWSYNDLSEYAQGGVPISDDPVMAPTGEIYVRGNGSQGNDYLLRYYYIGSGWKMDSVSSHIDWQLFLGAPAVYLSQDANNQAIVNVLAQRVDGQLIVCQKPPDPQPWSWVSLSASALGGTLVAGDPAVTPDGAHVYVRGTDNHLLDLAYASSQWQVSDLSVAAYETIIHDATSDAAGQAPKWIMLRSQLIRQNGSQGYPVFTVAPGDLTTYTPYSWNRRMQALAQANPGQGLYAGADYFDDVIAANAAILQGDLNCMPLSWGRAPGGVTSFKYMQSSFTEQNWTLEKSVYAGWGEGEGIQFFVVDYEFTFKFLVGYTINYEVTSTETSTQSWGLNFSGNTMGQNVWGPPPYKTPAQHPGAATSYSFSIYFLPAPDGSKTLPDGTKLTPNYWTKELQAGLQGQAVEEGDLDPATIDPGSGPWKAVYVVTNYAFVPTLEAIPASGPAGSSVSLAGIGYGTSFGVSDTVTFALLGASGGPVQLGQVLTDPNWSFGGTAFVPSATVTIPSVPPGNYQIQASVNPQDLNQPNQTVGFTVTASESEQSLALKEAVRHLLDNVDIRKGS